MSMIQSDLLLGQEGGAGYAISRSLRFNSSDSAYLSRTPASAGNRKTWTWASWVKASTSDVARFFAGENGSGHRFYIDLSSGNLRVGHNNGTWNIILNTTQVFRDFSAWFHLLVAADTTQATAANRVKIYTNGEQITSFSSSTYPAQNLDTIVNESGASLYQGYGGVANGAGYFNGYLADVHFIDGQALTPSSFTEVSATTGQLIPKAYTGSYGTNGFHLPFSDNSTAAALGTDTSGAGNDWTVNNISATQGNGSWLSVASITAGTPWSGRELYNLFNGVVANGNPNSAPYGFLEFQARPGTVTFSPALNASSTIKVWAASYTGGDKSVTLNGSTGYTFTNTSAVGTNATLYTLSVTSLSSITIPNGSGDLRLFGIEVDGVLLIDNGSAIAIANDCLVDTPTSYGVDAGNGGEVRGNYATFNPLVRLGTPSLSNGNLDTLSTGPNNTAQSTIAVTTGKWYAEFVASSQNYPRIGIQDIRETGADMNGSLTISWGAYSTGELFINGVATSTGGNIYSNGNVIGVAFDADTRKVWFSRNGTWVNFSGSGANPATGTNPVGTLAGTSAIAYAVRSQGCTVVANFGQRPFVYTAPSGFKALCDTNLPAPVVAQPSTVMDVKLYTGNGSTQTISGLGFSPDLVWIKDRTQAGIWHNLFDEVRGAGKRLASNATDAEATNQIYGYLSAFTSSGFTVTAGSSGADNVNFNNDAYAAWCWDAGSSTVTNTQGSITSSVRANPSAGFSIVTFTAPSSNQSFTVGHGLGIAPAFTILKRRDSSTGGDWWTWHIGLGDNTTDYLALNQTSAEGSVTLMWGTTGRTSSLLGFNAPNSIVASGTYVVYCFAPVEGYSAFGSYTGNGSTDGPAVFTSMRPRFLLIKRTDTTGNWLMYDSARDSFNSVKQQLYPNSSSAENPGNDLDFLSNGFKLRTTNTALNASGGTYVYASFAEFPFAYARAR